MECQLKMSAAADTFDRIGRLTLCGAQCGVCASLALQVWDGVKYPMLVPIFHASTHTKSLTVSVVPVLLSLVLLIRRLNL